MAIDLPTALAAIYDEAAYDLSIDYRQSPPLAPLPQEEAAWLQSMLPNYIASTNT